MRFTKTLSLLALISFGFTAFAQQPEIQFFRYRDQRGINQFEAPFYTDKQFEGLRIRIGGNFAQQFQALSHENSYDMDANPNPNPGGELYYLAPGFNLATANLNFDVQLADGIRVAIESYMSARRHPDFWVKGGYIQFDKLPMFDNTDWFTDYVTVKIGHMEVNYGDQHFRRSDNGNVAYNAFVGNYIVDQFATEIGGEVYIHGKNGLFGMVGLTSGFINGNIEDPNPFPDNDSLKTTIKRNPSLLLKLGWDNQVSEDLRLRFTGSMYMNNNIGRNTLYAGDRTGSRYYGVMEAPGANLTDNFRSGRLDPGFSNQVTAIMINAFVKFQGLEFFGTFETASGRAWNKYMDPDEEVAGVALTPTRTITQIGAEVVYRFLKDEQVFVGARFNSANGEFLNGNRDADGNIVSTGANRISVAAGWFMTRNLLLKLEYVNQNYDWANTNGDPLGGSDARLHEGRFGGLMVEAAVSF